MRGEGGRKKDWRQELCQIDFAYRKWVDKTINVINENDSKRKYNIIPSKRNPELTDSCGRDISTIILPRSVSFESRKNKPYEIKMFDQLGLRIHVAWKSSNSADSIKNCILPGLLTLNCIFME